MVLNVNNAILSPLQHRINSSVSYVELNGEEHNIIYSNIEKGIFNTDRIFLDPFFSFEQAYTRYVNWIQDECKKGAQLYEIQYKGVGIGFFTLKKINENTYFPFLAGMYPDQPHAGLGYSIVRKPIEKVISLNGKKISTYISSNNTVIYQIQTKQGFIPHESRYIFIKHNK